MKKKKKLSLEIIEVQSFVTSFLEELSDDELEKVFGKGGTDRVWMCPPYYVPYESSDSDLECLSIGE